MRDFRQWYRDHDGAIGLLRTLLGIGTHRVVIYDDNGQRLGQGEGATEGAAREQAWRNVQAGLSP